METGGGQAGDRWGVSVLQRNTLDVGEQEGTGSSSCELFSEHPGFEAVCLNVCFHSQEGRDSECFPVRIVVCAAFLSRRASRNCSKCLEEMLFAELQTCRPLLLFSFISARETV